MSQALNEFFAAEAGEYLLQFDYLLADEHVPDARRLFRLARGVRGSAEMAQVDRIAAVAGELERATRSLLDGQIRWDDDLRERVVRTVADLKVLVRSVRSWGSDEERLVRDAIARWQPGQPANGDSPAVDVQQEVTPIESLFYKDSGPHIVDMAEGLYEVVSIDALLLEPADALRRALSLRARLESLLSSGSGAGTTRELEELLTELFDLIQLAATAENRRAP